MKATKQYFFVVLFIMLCKVALAFESVNIVFSCSSDIVDTILQ